MKPTLLLLLALTCLVFSARADTPLPPPTTHSVTSSNGRFEARFTVSPELTSIFDTSTSKLLWSMSGFYRHAFLADDGRHLVTSYDGYNLIPVDAKPDLVLLEFFDGPKSIKRITLGDIIRDTPHLHRTISHLRWGNSIGFDADGRFCVETAEGRLLKFDPATGRLAKEEVIKPK